MRTSFEHTFQAAFVAARSGDPKAQLYLAVAYMRGIGITPSEGRAFEWCKRSAEQGNVRAQILLGYMVRNSTPEADGSSTRYFIEVPPHMESARAAVAWTFGMHEDDYSPVNET